MPDSQAVLRSPFNVEVHKNTFINYLEVVILKDGTIEYAVPSHIEKQVSLACKELNMTRDEINDLCPIEYYFDFHTWVSSLTDSISVWTQFHHGYPNAVQIEVLEMLQREELFLGPINRGKII